MCCNTGTVGQSHPTSCEVCHSSPDHHSWNNAAGSLRLWTVSPLEQGIALITEARKSTSNHPLIDLVVRAEMAKPCFLEETHATTKAALDLMDQEQLRKHELIPCQIPFCNIMIYRFLLEARKLQSGILKFWEQLKVTKESISPFD